MDKVQLAREIKTVITGVNGVFTDNRELEGAPFKAKWRSHYDGQGVSLLRAVGIQVIMVTNERDEAAQYIKNLVIRWNTALPSSSKWKPVHLFTGVRFADELELIEDWRVMDIFPERCAGMEHDLFFAPILKRVALPAAPITAEPAIKEYVQSVDGFISERPAGNGAFRDFANFILASRGIDPFALSPE